MRYYNKNIEFNLKEKLCIFLPGNNDYIRKYEILILEKYFQICIKLNNLITKHI